MRTRMLWLTLLLGMVATLDAQDRPPQQVTPPPQVEAPAKPTPKSAPAPAKPQPMRDLSKLTPLEQQMVHSALRGAEWLRRVNRPDGRFSPGQIPALRATLEGDPYLHQVRAAYALARAARFFGDERLAAFARQAVLTLLLETAIDTQDPQVRHTVLPSTVVNRLGGAGWLVLAVHELPSPGDDLLEQAEQLCQFLRKQQQPDGSLRATDGADIPELIQQHVGPALYALMLSQQHRPASWKMDVVRKALPFYRAWWRDHKHPAFVPMQTAAFAEAFVRTQEEPFADFVCEMNDWLCGLQYTQLDPRHPLWQGGFMSWAEGKPSQVAPRIDSAACAWSLGEACRTVRRKGKLDHYQRYREAQERCLQFVTTLQYTEANTQHFADWYRPALVGGFFAHHQDGTLRLDYTQQAVTALVRYLQE